MQYAITDSCPVESSTPSSNHDHMKCSPMATISILLGGSVLSWTVIILGVRAIL